MAKAASSNLAEPTQAFLLEKEKTCGKEKSTKGQIKNNDKRMRVKGETLVSPWAGSLVEEHLSYTTARFKKRERSTVGTSYRLEAWYLLANRRS